MASVARLTEVDEIAPDVLQLEARLVDPSTMRFRAGQFVSLLVPADAGNGLQKRPYSIASPPARADGFELVAKLVAGGLASEWLRGRGPGDEIPFVGPAGHFTVFDRHPGDAVFAVTGTGIAAALPMIGETLGRPAADEPGRVLLFWGLRSERDVYWVDRLDELAARSGRFSYSLCLSRPSPSWAGVQGRIVGRVKDVLAMLEQPVFYLVGNGEMVRELRAALAERGVDRRQRIRTEVFYPVAEP